MVTRQSKKSIKAEGGRTVLSLFFQVPFLFLLGLGALGNFISFQPSLVSAENSSPSPVTTDLLEIPSSDKNVKLSFTLYRAKTVQYFSAGVGVEERNATYPPYPLKLIFVQGERAFLAEVEILMVDKDGTTLVEIPKDHVMGPWLFVQIPPGTYTIIATDSHQRTIKSTVQIAGTGTKVVHIRFPAS